MFCTKSQDRDRGESAAKESFLALTRMGFKTLESIAILNLRKYRVISWLKSDANFCEEIKSIPDFGKKRGA